MANNNGTKKTNTSAKGKKKQTQIEEDTSFLQSEITILGTFAVCVFLFLSNFHICGTVGNFFSSIMLGVFGTIGYLAPVLLFAGILFYASNEGNIRAVYKMLAVEILLIVFCGLAQMMFGGGYQEGQTLMDIYRSAGESGVGGGLIGGAIVFVLHTALGMIGTYLILLLLLVISMVCITEKSFVSAVKSGSGKVYQYAKEENERQKEIREIKKEEKRRLREEQKVQGVNLESTDLSKDSVGKKVAASKEELPAEETTRKITPESVAQESEKISDPADVFKGKITKAGMEEEEDVVPFEEDIKIQPLRRDEDVFVTRDSRMFREMGLFPEQKNEPSYRPTPAMAVYHEPEIEPDEIPVTTSVYEEPIYEIPVEIPVQEPELEPMQTMSVYEEPKITYETPVTPDYEEPEPFIEDVDPAKIIEESKHFHKQEEHKRVVTATGKVIETDTETILKQKAEKRKQEAEEKAEANNAVLKEIQKTEEKPKKPYVYPSTELLTRGNGPSLGQSDKEFKETAIKLQQTLRNFGVGVTVTNISCGPTVTRYELHPEQGVKVSKIQALADDIKLNLAATDIRIEAPIPGKAAVGIEVPNKVNSTVYLRELIESNEFKKHPSRLAFAVGKDIGGQVIVADIAKMPHLLIAGQTGSGKSVGINTMIMSLIYRSSPDDVKLIMIDPKVVELSVYNGIPHLLIPVVTDPKKAAGALNWAVAEMMERYNKFAQSNVRDIKGYNARVQSLIDAGDVPKEEIPSKLPQLVIIIDELADLMMVASNEVEDAICRLAQLARAAGIHLVIATQRPSVNVITGVIKANVPSRIAFSVASGVDSRTILDMNGAEKLLGNGDMLFYPSGYPKPVRVQGAFVSDAEVSRVTDFLKEQNENGGYNKEVEMKLSQPTLNGGSAGGGSDRDSLFTDAGKFIIEKDKASIGMLQRVFKIGFNRAARIMDQLAEAGVVGEEEGTKPRKVLMSMEEFEEFLEAGY